MFSRATVRALRAQACIWFLAAGLAAVPSGGAAAASAAPSSPGFAYDSFSTFPADWTVDLATINPVPFDPAYTNAATTFLPGPHSNVSSDEARAALRNFRLYGIASRHFVLGTKRRVDDLSVHMSTITDCATNTITQIDNDRHTYRRFTAPVPPGGPDGAYPHFTITLTTKSLGMVPAGGSSFPAFSASATVVVAAGPGFASTSTIALRALASNLPSAASTCAPSAASGSAQDPSGQAAFLQTLLAGIISKDPHFTVNRTGPPLPIGRMPVFSAIRRSTGDGVKPVTVVTQNGHFRTLGPADAGLFAVPPGYAPAPGRMQAPN